jgi:hypothetical protein
MPLQFTNDSNSTGVFTLYSPNAKASTITLPAALGTNGQLVIANSFGVSGTWDFTSITPSTVYGWAQAFNSGGTNASVNVSSMTAGSSGANSNCGIAFVPTSTRYLSFAGPFTTVVPDGAQSGGNSRGSWAFDAMGYGSGGVNRVGGSAFVASGQYSNVVSVNGKASGQYSSAYGGSNSQATGGNSVCIAGYTATDVGNFGAMMSSGNSYAGQYSVGFTGAGYYFDVAYTYGQTGSGGTGTGNQTNITRGMNNATYAVTTDATLTYLTNIGGSTSAPTNYVNSTPYAVTASTTYRIYILATKTDFSACYYWLYEGSLNYNPTTWRAPYAFTLITSGGDSALSTCAVTMNVTTAFGTPEFYIGATGIAATSIKWQAWFTQVDVRNA